MSVTATLVWAWTGEVDRSGLSPDGGPVATEVPVTSRPTAYRQTSSLLPATRTATFTGNLGQRARIRPNLIGDGVGRRSHAGLPAGAASSRRHCRLGQKLVPTCGVLWGVAPGARTEEHGFEALVDFERKTGRHQAVYHAYHHGIRQLFPTPQEIAIARQPGRERVLLLNWKPESVSWARIARGDRRTDEFLDELAWHLRRNYREPFFFAIHHEAEDQVRERPGSGYTARDYAAMFRHVVKRLRAHGANNVITVLIHMAYVPHTTKRWFSHMYPGDDVVDWIGFDTYSYSDPGYGHGDFAELLNRRSSLTPRWPGFYNWVGTHHPDKPLMVAEWGVWFSKRNPGHMAEFYREVGQQIRYFPAIRAMVHFETPANQKGQDSSVDSTPAALREYRRLGRLPVFQVALR
ncbi:glycosyl hydrolase [Actinoplanes regularis]|uniref:Glycosyl hydrolase family 26 n=1 Tax=Actinoplanes regularis TaxID=52697 RepID=A0A238XEA6_9ACTN|nr:glycosyl hydrolase [Actinoplanes regularis]GIE86729.1 hypothetical protein Are01nite_32090 [Actinoplanes regularis]SNR57257.1 Glycosyl hydrolase family 26 [Actinoplanes regularis]